MLCTESPLCEATAGFSQTRRADGDRFERAHALWVVCGTARAHSARSGTGIAQMSSAEIA
eukprot:3515842-Rhodomonas_salina.3